MFPPLAFVLEGDTTAAGRLKTIYAETPKDFDPQGS